MGEGRLRRSELAVPAASTKMIAKSAASEADLVFLDLEDATAPALKEEARKNVIEGLKTLEWGRTLRAVRVNSADTQLGHGRRGRGRDPRPRAPGRHHHPEAVRDRGTSGSSRPCSTSSSRSSAFEPRIKLRSPDRGGPGAGLAGGGDRCVLVTRLEALILGFGDLAASLGLPRRPRQRPTNAYPGDPWHAARSRMIAACRANGLDADRRPLCELHEAGRLSPRGELGQHPGRGRQVVHPPEPDRDRQRRLRPDREGDRVRQGPGGRRIKQVDRGRRGSGKHWRHAGGRRVPATLPGRARPREAQTGRL